MRAPSDDKNDKQDEHKGSDENNFDDAKNNDNSSSGAAEPKQPEMLGSKKYSFSACSSSVWNYRYLSFYASRRFFV
jgi:hypothetical protein